MEHMARHYWYAIDQHRIKLDQASIVEGFPLGVVAGPAQRLVLQRVQATKIGPGHGTGAASRGKRLQLTNRPAKIYQLVFFKAARLVLLAITQKERCTKI